MNYSIQHLCVKGINSVTIRAIFSKFNVIRDVTIPTTLRLKKTSPGFQSMAEVHMTEHNHKLFFHVEERRTRVRVGRPTVGGGG